MKTGIRFLFDHKIGLDLGQDVISFYLSQEFHKGQMRVCQGERELGIAGQLSDDVVATIPKGVELSIIVDVDKEKAAKFSEQIADLNAHMGLRNNKVFTVVEPA